MKKKIILLVLCAVLLLIFTSSSYGGFDPRALPKKEHPDQELLSPRNSERPDRLLLLISPNYNGLFFILCAKSGFARQNPNFESLTARTVQDKIGNVEKAK
jgi:hypothetical protein